RRLLADVEGPPAARRAEDLVGLLREAIEPAEQAAVALVGAEGVLQVPAQVLPALQRLRRQAAVERDAADRERLAGPRRRLRAQGGVLDAEHARHLRRPRDG